MILNTKKFPSPIGVIFSLIEDIVDVYDSLEELVSVSYRSYILTYGIATIFLL